MLKTCGLDNNVIIAPPCENPTAHLNGPCSMANFATDRAAVINAVVRSLSKFSNVSSLASSTQENHGPSINSDVVSSAACGASSEPFTHDAFLNRFKSRNLRACSALTSALLRHPCKTKHASPSVPLLERLRLIDARMRRNERSTRRLATRASDGRPWRASSRATVDSSRAHTSLFSCDNMAAFRARRARRASR